MGTSDLKISQRQLHAACDVWGRTPTTGGGTLGLGLWLSKHKPHFTVADYAELVAMVRAELGDDTDYSTVYDVAPPTTPMDDLLDDGAGSVTLSGGGRSVTLTAETHERAQEWSERTRRLHVVPRDDEDE